MAEGSPRENLGKRRLQELRWEVISDPVEWDRFVQSVEHATPFHAWQWGQLISEKSGVPTFLGCRDASGLLAAGCPFVSVPKGGGLKVLDSRRYTDLWGPVFRKSDHYNGRVLTAVRASLGGLLRHRVVMVRLRVDDRTLADALGGSGAEYTTESGYFLLDLEKKTPDLIWDGTFAHRHRRIINYFERVEAAVRVSSDEEEFTSFLKLNSETMAAQRYRVYPPSFFQGIRKQMGKEFMTLNVSIKERCVGTIGFFVDAKRSTIFPSYSGYDGQIPRSPFFFAYWSLIKWSSQSGFRFLNFGNTSSNPTHRNHILKKSLGGEFVPQYTIVMPTNNILYSLARSVNSILRR